MQHLDGLGGRGGDAGPRGGSSCGRRSSRRPLRHRAAFHSVRIHQHRIIVHKQRRRRMGLRGFHRHFYAQTKSASIH